MRFHTGYLWPWKRVVLTTRLDRYWARPQFNYYEGKFCGNDNTPLSFADCILVFPLQNRFAHLSRGHLKAIWPHMGLYWPWKHTFAARTKFPFWFINRRARTGTFKSRTNHVWWPAAWFWSLLNVTKVLIKDSFGEGGLTPSWDHSG